jgi:hypothetical protein
MLHGAVKIGVAIGINAGLMIKSSGNGRKLVQAFCQEAIFVAANTARLSCCRAGRVMDSFHITCSWY